MLFKLVFTIFGIDMKQALIETAITTVVYNAISFELSNNYEFYVEKVFIEPNKNQARLA